MPRGGGPRSPPTKRAGKLDAAADALEARRDELVPLADEETRLGAARLGGELTRTTFQLRLFADQVRDAALLDVRIDRPDGEWTPGPRPDLRRYRTALGPVLVFAASNFPFAFSVAGGDTASALATGCPVVVKAHPGHPRLSRLTADIVEDALDSPGVFGLIEGNQNGVDALRDPGITAVAFTGSVRGGLALSRIAAERPDPIPFYGELGSINPVVVSPAAAAGSAGIAEGYVGSLIQGTGQFCTNPGALFVPEGSDLVDRVAEQLRPVPTAPMLNDRIAEGYREGARRWAEKPDVHKVVWPEDDPLVPRLLSMDLASFAEDPEAAEECFGPLGVVVRYSRIDELTAVLSRLPGQLTTTLHADEGEAEQLGESSSVWISCRAGAMPCSSLAALADMRVDSLRSCLVAVEPRLAVAYSFGATGIQPREGGARLRFARAPGRSRAGVPVEVNAEFRRLPSRFPRTR